MLTPMMESLAHDCVMQDKSTISDGEGGVITTYKDGAEFKTYPALDTSALARIAEAQGSKSSYSVLVPKSVQIGVGDIFRDKTDGAYFRVTSDPKETPSTSTLDLKAFTAEKTELPA